VIVTPRIALRLALIVIVAVIVQVSFFSFLSILGATPYVVPVVIVSLGLLGGGVVGAVCGFFAGLLMDSLLLSIGYLAGRYREGFEIRGRIVPALLTGGFTLVGAAALAAIELMLGVDAPVSLLVVREILVQALLATALAFAVYPLVRRALGAALVDYQPRSRLLSVGRLRRRRRRPRRGIDHTAPRRRPRALHGGV
jgi:rod shape-determining protein MreD